MWQDKCRLYVSFKTANDMGFIVKVCAKVHRHTGNVPAELKALFVIVNYHSSTK